jgi:hypothetical protein
VAGSRIRDHGIRKILQQASVADRESHTLFGIRGAGAMTVQASGPRCSYLRECAGLDFDIQRQAIPGKHASRDVVQMY